MLITKKYGIILILFLLLFMLPLAAADDTDELNLEELWELYAQMTAGINEGDTVEYRILNDDVSTTIFGNVGFNLGGGYLLGIGGLAMNPYYSLRYYPIKTLSFSIYHHLAHINVLGDPIMVGNDPHSVGPDPKFFSYLKSGIDWNFLVIDETVDHKLVIDADFTGTTNTYYYIDVPFHQIREFSVRAGYVHRLGGIGFMPMEVYYGEGDSYSSEYFVHGNAYYHGVYLGLSYTSRHDLDLIYRVLGQKEVREGSTHEFIKQSLDVHYYPYCELATEGGPIEITAALGFEYTFNGVLMGDKGKGFGLDIILGAGPFAAPVSPGEYESPFNDIVNNVYLGLGLGFTLAGSL